MWTPDLFPSLSAHSLPTSLDVRSLVCKLELADVFRQITVEPFTLLCTRLACSAVTALSLRTQPNVLPGTLCSPSNVL